MPSYLNLSKQTPKPFSQHSLLLHTTPILRVTAGGFIRQQRIQRLQTGNDDGDDNDSTILSSQNGTILQTLIEVNHFSKGVRQIDEDEPLIDLRSFLNEQAEKVAITLATSDNANTRGVARYAAEGLRNSHLLSDSLIPITTTSMPTTPLQLIPHYVSPFPSPSSSSSSSYPHSLHPSSTSIISKLLSPVPHSPLFMNDVVIDQYELKKARVGSGKVIKNKRKKRNEGREREGVESILQADDDDVDDKKSAIIVDDHSTTINKTYFSEGNFYDVVGVFPQIIELQIPSKISNTTTTTTILPPPPPPPPPSFPSFQRESSSQNNYNNYDNNNKMKEVQSFYKVVVMMMIIFLMS